MSQEQSKAAKRRRLSPAFLTRYFVRDGIDIGSGDDPLVADKEVFPLITSVMPWDEEQGDAQFMADVADGRFDFVHASHCLEHMQDPYQALGHWIRIAKPGGHVIVAVPDEDMYEQGHWPSLFNDDHKWTFTVNKRVSWSPASRNILVLIAHFTHLVSIEKIEVIRDHYHRDPDVDDVDHTKDPLIEAAIEFVLRKHTQPEGQKP